MNKFNIPPGKCAPWNGEDIMDVEYPTPEEIRALEDDAIIDGMKRRNFFGKVILDALNKRPR